jgi:G3E family GTPase
VQITVVDSDTFIQEYACRNPVATRPDLGGDDSGWRPVVDLLVEQIEMADYVILNKIDLLGKEKVPELSEIVKSINPLCEVIPCVHGEVRLDT